MNAHRSVSVIALLVAAAAAQAGKSVGARPGKAAFTEIWRVGPPAADPRVDPFPSAGRFKFLARIPLAEGDAATFDANTNFQLAIGDFTYEEVLGSDPNWTPGKRAARLVQVDDDGAPVLVVKLRWSDRELTVNAQAQTGAFEGTILAERHQDDGSSKFAESVEAQITLGGSTAGWHEVQCRGAVRTLPEGRPLVAVVRDAGRSVTSSFFATFGAWRTE